MKKLQKNQDKNNFTWGLFPLHNHSSLHTSLNKGSKFELLPIIIKMEKKIWKEGNCIRCGLKQKCLIEDIEKSPLSFWRCIYCDEAHTIKSIKRED